ncbi:MAG: hypothetical protein HS116_15565 [Planctomycetes bacterium]|nr:hypothetical protein [Planctomycetota bacterium]
MPTFLKAFGIGGLMVVLGIFWVQRDMRLRIWGQETDALLTGDWESTGARRGGKHRKISYTFTPDPSQPRVQGGATVPDEWVPPGTTVKVEYLPSDPKVNRMVGQGGVTGYLLILAGLGISGVGVYLVMNESVKDSHATATPIDARPKIVRKLLD